MIAKEQLNEFFLQYAKEHPDSVKTNITVGDLIRLSARLVYVVDTLDVKQFVEPYERGKVPLGPIYRSLRHAQREVHTLFDKKGKNKFRDNKKINVDTVLPFSCVLENGLGGCLESSLLLQILCQDDHEFYLLTGTMCEGKFGWENHAFNVRNHQDHSYLIDVTNPFRKNQDETVVPYCLQIEEITTQGEFVLPKKFNLDRIYSLIR